MKTKFIAILLSILSIAILNANEIIFNNLTPENIPQNPSQTYSIDVEVIPMSSSVEKNSIKPIIVIDGKSHPMTKGINGVNSYTFDFKMPKNVNVARYYFAVDYETKVFVDSAIKERSIKSNLFDLHITNRYTTSLDVTRGPVGATIRITGRGLSSNDIILFGDTEVPTSFLSPYDIAFKVPTLPANRIYDVALQGNNGRIFVGEFKIDPSTISTDQEFIHLKSNERVTLTLEIDSPAPKGGLELDITTDIPESIIMPEIIIPEGSKIANITMQGGVPGNGSIFIQADGYDELEIPLAINEDIDNFWSF